jgi:hypothetical protein
MATTINSNTTDGVIITPDTSGEIELQADGVTKAKITANGLQDNNGNSLRGGMYRNLIINGDMNIAQRGTSFTSISQGSNEGYTLDRWRFHIFSSSAHGTYTVSQDTDVPSGQGFANSLKVSCTTADTSLAADPSVIIDTRLEGQNLQHLKKGTSSAEKLTASFWVKSNLTGNAVLYLFDHDNSREIASLVNISTANTWEKKTITFDGDTTGAFDNDNANSLTVRLYMAAGSDQTSGTLPTSWQDYNAGDTAVGISIDIGSSTSNYINITGVQLEVGEGASDFEHLPYDVQLQRCMRYFEKSYSQEHSLGTVTQNGAEQWLANRNPGTPHYFLKFRTVKRSTPTVTIYNSSTGGTGTFRNVDAGTNIAGAASRIGDNGTTLYSTVSTSLGQFIQFHYTAESEL